MIKYTLLLICFVSGFLSECTNTTKDLEYSINPKIIEAKGIEIHGSLHANLKSGELSLVLKVKNNSENNVTVNYLDCSLSVDNERVVIPETRKQFKTVIRPGAGEKYEIQYHPINSLDFFNIADYRGDLKQRYSLWLDFIKDKFGNPLQGKSFIFELQDSAYHNYLRDYGRESEIQLYDCRINADSFITDQKNYLKKIGLINESKSDAPEYHEDNFVLATNSEFNIGNRIINFKSYKQKDSLIMNIWVINMAFNKLRILLDKLGIEDSGHYYFPDKIVSEFFNYNEIIDSSIIVKPGARFNVQLKYVVPQKCDQYLLSSDWLRILINREKPEKDEYVKLIYKDLIFKNHIPTAN
jgi:hypothetical protein